MHLSLLIALPQSFHAAGGLAVAVNCGPNHTAQHQLSSQAKVIMIVIKMIVINSNTLQTRFTISSLTVQSY